MKCFVIRQFSLGKRNAQKCVKYGFHFDNYFKFVLGPLGLRKGILLGQFYNYQYTIQTQIIRMI